MSEHIFRHNDPDSAHSNTITLHDCTANHIECFEAILRFTLPNGFQITQNHEANPFFKTIKTDAAVVDFRIKDPNDITVRVLTRHRFRKTTVEDWEISRLLQTVNSGSASLEFLTQYKSYYEQLWHCVLHSDQKPYYRECLLYLPEAKATYCWNELRPEYEW